MAPKYIRSELLCYAFQHVNECTAKALEETIRGFYGEDDISRAKTLLWENFEPLIGKMKERSNTSLDAADIVEGIKKLMKDHTYDGQTVFCAVDLDNIPKYKPEEINLFAIANQLAQMQRDIKATKDLAHKNAGKISAMEAGNKKNHSAKSQGAEAPPKSFSTLVTGV